MGTSEKVRVIAASSEPLVLTLETSWFPAQAPQKHVVAVTLAEFKNFQAALSSKLFGSSPHVVSVESISNSGSAFKCTLRIASKGSRQRNTFEISASTYAAIEAVFDSNIISEGYIRA